MPALKPISFDNNDNQVLQNYYRRDGEIHKIPGTNKYNTTALASPIKWTGRYYGLKADKSLTKKTFAYCNGGIYLGNDVNKTFAKVKDFLKVDCYPESCTVQVADNSRMYIFNGYDTPVYDEE
jgi:hypothetical protein